jgi:Na+/melibiose symporter-like transporter
VEPDAIGHVNKTLTALSAEGARMLVSVLVTFLVIILVLYLVNMLPLDGRAKQIARVIVIIIGVLSLLKYIAVF